MAALHSLFTDGKYIFAVTYKEVGNGGFYTDVFDADRNEYICSTMFPSHSLIKHYPTISIIKNGKVYKMNEYYLNDEFPRIDVYSVKPEVYGK